MNEIERQIVDTKRAMDTYVSLHTNATDAVAKGHYSDEIRRLNAKLAKLVAQRSPQVIAKLELARGLV